MQKQANIMSTEWRAQKQQHENNNKGTTVSPWKHADKQSYYQIIENKRKPLNQDTFKRLLIKILWLSNYKFADTLESYF